MAFRLQDLQRQRALIQEHLRWLDAQIEDLKAESIGEERAPASFLPEVISYAQEKFLTNPPSLPQIDLPKAEVSTGVADEILAEYQNDPKNLRENVKKGLLLYFCLALASVAAVIAVIHLAYSQRP